MKPYRKNAIMVGIFFIMATVAGILGLVALGPVLTTPFDLTSVSAYETQLKMGALFALIMALACAAIPIAAYPVLKKHNEALAMNWLLGT